MFYEVSFVYALPLMRYTCLKMLLKYDCPFFPNEYDYCYAVVVDLVLALVLVRRRVVFLRLESWSYYVSFEF